MTNPFGDDFMAAGYAASRPAVHPRVIDQLRVWMDGAVVHRAADIGCGAGLSTRPLASLARMSVGFDPAESMVRVAARVVPGALFVTAGGEAMPFDDHSIDLLTAAGSLNYARDLDATFAEAVRVLAPGGLLAVYDFSPGRSFVDSDRLDAWFEAFIARYPFPASQARPLSPSLLEEAASDLVLVRGETFEIPLALEPAFHVDYMLTETCVQDAVRRGTPLESIRSWVTETLAPVFDGRPHDVLFRGYLATLTGTQDLRITGTQGRRD
jgi:SAM-dependent methyltransferase